MNLKELGRIQKKERNRKNCKALTEIEIIKGIRKNQQELRIKRNSEEL